MNMVFSMIIVFIALVISGIGLSWHIVYLPVIMVLEYFFALGMAFIFSALNVYFRDLEHILGIVTMAWFYFTPIVYTIEMVPEAIFGTFLSKSYDSYDRCLSGHFVLSSNTGF